MDIQSTALFQEKEAEIKVHAIDIIDYLPDDQDLSDLHDECFNADYYIIGIYESKQWLGNHVFEAIGIVQEYEQSNFGQICTDLSDPEKVTNMITYIFGEMVLYGCDIDLEGELGEVKEELLKALA